MIVMLFLPILFICIISGVHTLWNVQKDRRMLHEGHAADTTTKLEIDLSNLTDKERPYYRYPY